MCENISDDLRQVIFARDNYTCQYCGCSGDETELEIEHIIPISKGGNNDIRNLCTACKNCNRKKGARILTTGELQQIADKINSSLEYLMSLASEEPENEKRTEKITIYMTPSMMSDTRDLCALHNLRNKSMNIDLQGFIRELITREIDKNRERISKLRELRATL